MPSIVCLVIIKATLYVQVELNTVGSWLDKCLWQDISVALMHRECQEIADSTLPLLSTTVYSVVQGIASPIMQLP
jgi:hypothetical protein